MAYNRTVYIINNLPEQNNRFQCKNYIITTAERNHFIFNTYSYISKTNNMISLPAKAKLFKRFINFVFDKSFITLILYSSFAIRNKILVSHFLNFTIHTDIVLVVEIQAISFRQRKPFDIQVQSFNEQFEIFK